MTTRTKFQLGLVAAVAAIGALMSSCAGLPPIGRTEYCYWYSDPFWPPPSAPTTTALVCHDEPLEPGPNAPSTAPSSTLYGYVAPAPAGTRVVK